jgi:hypothetical protein
MTPSYSLSAQLGLTTRLGKSGALPTADRGGDWNGISSSSVPVSSNIIGVRRGRTMENFQRRRNSVDRRDCVAGMVSVQHNAGPIAPAECAGHRRPSKSGVPGLPGSKSGPTVTRYGTTALEGCTEAAKWRSEQGYRASRPQSRPDRQAYEYRPISRTRGQGVGKPRPTSHLGLSMTLFQRG